MSCAWITHPDCRRHDMGEGHPECGARLDAISDFLTSTRLMPYLAPCEAPLATEQQLALAHTSRYVRQIHASAPREGYLHLDPDTSMNAHSLAAALRAAGAAILGAEMVVRGEYQRAFCAVRPPGHHATRDGAMGFCIFNNVAVAARYFQVHLGVNRVAILDWDVHHGNGTQDMFWDDPTVFFVSMHQWPFWPGSGGPGEGNETTLNVPMEAGSGDEAYVDAFERLVEPPLRAFEPELLLVSAGFDAGAGDLLGGMRMTEAGFAELARRAQALAPRLALVLEGGYTLETLPGFVRSVAEPS